jgi:hypothetical protein
MVKAKTFIVDTPVKSSTVCEAKTIHVDIEPYETLDQLALKISRQVGSRPWSLYSETNKRFICNGAGRKLRKCRLQVGSRVHFWYSPAGCDDSLKCEIVLTSFPIHERKETIAPL